MARVTSGAPTERKYTATMTRIVRIVAASIHGSALSISSHCASRAGPGAGDAPRGAGRRRRQRRDVGARRARTVVEVEVRRREQVGDDRRLALAPPHPGQRHVRAAARRRGCRASGSAASAARSCASTAARESPRGLRSTATVSVATEDPNSCSARSCVRAACAPEGTMSLSGADAAPPSPGRKTSAAASAATQPMMIGQRSATTRRAYPRARRPPAASDTPCRYPAGPGVFALRHGGDPGGIRSRTCQSVRPRA